MSETPVCNHSRTGATSVGTTCEVPPVAAITVACVHEHFTDAHACAAHLPAMIAIVERGNAQCGACRRARCVPCRVRLIDERRLAAVGAV